MNQNVRVGGAKLQRYFEKDSKIFKITEKICESQMTRETKRFKSFKRSVFLNPIDPS